MSCLQIAQIIRNAKNPNHQLLAKYVIIFKTTGYLQVLLLLFMKLPIEVDLLLKMMYFFFIFSSL